MNKLRFIKGNIIIFSLISLLFSGCTKTNTLEKEGSKPLYTSAYSDNLYKIGKYNIKDWTAAPLQNVLVMQFDQPVDVIFGDLLTKVDQYVEEVTKVNFDHGKSANTNTFGVGSERICFFDNGDILHEPIVAYETNKFYAYTVGTTQSTKWLPIKDAVLFYIFEKKAPNKTLVTLRAYYNTDLFLMGWMVKPMFSGSIEDSFLQATKIFDGQVIEPRWKS